MFECGTCGYQTNRSFNFNLHNSRKTPCKPKNVISNVINVNDNKNKLENVSNNVNVFDANTVKKKDSLSCPICLRRFTTRQAKSLHKKNVKCKPPVELETQEENNRLKIQMAGYMKATNHDTEYIQLKEEENAALKKEAHKIKVELENKKLKNTIEALKRENEMNETNELKPNKPKLKRGFVNQVTRNKVAASQKWCCRMCSEILPGVFHIDHTRPLRYGGEDVLENVTALCIQCHAEKTQNDFILWDNIANEEMAIAHEVLPIKYETPSGAHLAIPDPIGHK